MRRFLSRLAVPALGGLMLLALVPSAVTADLPPDKLTEAAVRQRVAAALAADKSGELAAVRDLVNVDPAGISYKPGALNWRYAPKPGVDLIPERRQGVENALRGLLGRALGAAPGAAPGADNLKPEDLAALQKGTTFSPVAQLPPPAPAGGDKPVTPVQPPAKPPVTPPVTPPATPPAQPPAPPAVSPEEVAKLKAALQQADRDRAAQAKQIADLAEQLKKLSALDEQARKLAAAQDALKKMADEVKAAQDAARKAADEVKAAQDAAKKAADDARTAQDAAKKVADDVKGLREGAKQTGEDVKGVREGTKQLGTDLKGVQDSVKKLDSQVADAAKKLAEQNKAVTGDVGKLATRLDEEARARLAEVKRLQEERQKLADQAAADLKKLSDQTAQDLKRANEQINEQVKKVQTLLGTENEKLRTAVDEQVGQANARLADEARRLNERIDETFRKANARIDAESARLGQRITGEEQRSGLQTYRLDRRLNRLLEVMGSGSPAPAAGPCGPALPAAAPRAVLQAPAMVNVRLPAEARLFANNVPIPLVGPSRTFQTPPLEYGDVYAYNLRAEVGQGRDLRSLSRRVAVEAGKTTGVDLNDVLRQPAAGDKPARKPVPPGGVKPVIPGEVRPVRPGGDKPGPGIGGRPDKPESLLVLEGLADPARRDNVVQALRSVFRMSRDSAVNLVDRAPQPVQSYPDRKEAEAVADKLRAAGAKVSVR